MRSCLLDGCVNQVCVSSVEPDAFVAAIEAGAHMVP
jgi:hypothetical protein